MKIVLSPAKSLDLEAFISPIEPSIPHFVEEADYLAKKMQKNSVKKIAALMHLSSDLAHLNFERYQQWEKPVQKTAMHKEAGFAFSGEVYRGLQLNTFSPELLQKAQERIRILSGLYGVLKPLDLMYPYRLEMGTKWTITPKTKNLYSFWGSKIANYLNEDFGEESNPVLINLASTEYFKSVDLKKLKARVITPVFKEFKNGEYKIVMMFAKHQRGAMARFILENDIHDPEMLKTYVGDGYQFEINQSSENEWVFIR